MSLLAVALPLLTVAITAVGRPDTAQLHAPAPRAAAVAPATYKIDVTHSELSFRIRHFMSRVSGSFREWNGTITADPASLSGGSVEVTINTASIDTRNERRDTHLRSDEFFDAANHPALTFRSRSVEVQGTQLKLAGDLTIRGVTRPVVLEGEFLGTQGSGPGKERIGFSASTKINRLDYGVSWNRTVEGGGAMLGDEVQIDIAVEAVRQP
jgi:polyisoprenoid-binding protein YceI